MRETTEKSQSNERMGGGERSDTKIVQLTTSDGMRKREKGRERTQSQPKTQREFNSGNERKQQNIALTK